MRRTGVVLLTSTNIRLSVGPELFRFFLFVPATLSAFFDDCFVQGAKSVTAPATSGLQMRARVCDLLGKKPNRKARVVTFSHKRIHKVTNHTDRAFLSHTCYSVIVMVDELGQVEWFSHS